MLLRRMGRVGRVAACHRMAALFSGPARAGSGLFRTHRPDLVRAGRLRLPGACPMVVHVGAAGSHDSCNRRRRDAATHQDIRRSRPGHPCRGRPGDQRRQRDLECFHAAMSLSLFAWIGRPEPRLPSFPLIPRPTVASSHDSESGIAMRWSECPMGAHPSSPVQARAPSPFSATLWTGFRPSTGTRPIEFPPL